MSLLKKVLAGTAGLAAVAGLASPAEAQYYPGYGYGNNVGNAIGQAISGVLGATQNGGYGNYGYGNYGYGQGYGINSNAAVAQCARALEARGGYGYGGSRVTGIRNIEQRNNGAVRVNGMLSTYSGYGYGQPNLSFSCKVDRYGRVTDLRIDRDMAYDYGGYRGW